MLIAFILLLLFGNRLPAVMQSLREGPGRRAELPLLRQTICGRASRLPVLPADPTAFGIELPAAW
jgi:hypothetical protein